MKKYYFFILLCLPVLIFAQIAFTSGITPDLSAYGEAINYPGEGEYQVFLSADNILDKPIIVVDGFDPGDARDIAGLYSLLDFNGTSGTQNLADLVRAEGFDVVILNFPTYTRAADGSTIDGGADFIERNAMLLVELINIINTDKASNSPEQNVIIGPSMGGLISRYALNYMEANTLNADTRLYISFDSPHHGANVPIGLQHQLNYLAFNDLNPVAEIQPLINGLLKSAAARQLLIDHFEPHLQSGSMIAFDPLLTLPQEHPFRTQFQTNINSFTTNGFPENVRNVSIINGSGIGSPYFAIGNSGTVVTNGFNVINTTFNIPVSIFNIVVDLDINLTPAAGVSSVISNIVIDPPFVPATVETANSESFSFSDGVDAAPGGLFDLAGITGDIGSGGGLAADFLNALQIDKFSFIPSVSALALESTNNEIDWHQDIDLSGGPSSDTTPFVNTYLPDDNEPHVQLTEGNVAFALDEILTPPLSISDIDSFAFRLEKNPIENELVLLSNTTLNNTSISLIDMTGKVLFNSNQALNERTVLPINLPSGLYILNVSTKNSRNYSTKVIIN